MGLNLTRKQPDQVEKRTDLPKPDNIGEAPGATVGGASREKSKAGLGSK